MKKILNKFFVLNEEQKQNFLDCLPSKVYKTELNVAYVVVLLQLVMIVLFLVNHAVTMNKPRALGFYCLYCFLFFSTIIALLLYRYTYINKKQKLFIWMRRVYACAMCFWVIGITYLEQMNGGSGSTYCYLLPTMAALLLLTPVESSLLFGTSWVCIAGISMSNPTSGYVFSNVVNISFVTILSLVVSYRYYHSLAVEFCDHQIIAAQYEEIEKNNAMLKQMAHLDQLTKLYNRHYLTETLLPTIDRGRVQSFYGMFIMLDIDFFKSYNDTYGHVQGDECLRKVAEEINLQCKQYGLTAVRFGGEEFLVIKMDENPIDAQKYAKILLQAIWDLNLIRSDIDTKQVSVSIGLWSDNLANVNHIEAAIKHADTALYEAKKAGRNCIIDSKQLSK